MALLALIRDLWRDRRGNAILIVAAGIPLLVAAAGLGVDTFSLSILKRQLQRAADSGALAGGYAMVNDADLAGIETAVDRDLTINEMRTRLSENPTVEEISWSGTSVSGATTTRPAVRVALAAPGHTPFINFFLRRTITVAAEATAAPDLQGEYCIVALYNGADSGLTISGGGNVDLGCGMITNATGSSALNVNGNPTIDAEPLAAAGGVNGASGSAVLENQEPEGDPLSHIPDPPDCTTILPAISVPSNTSMTPDPAPTASGECYASMDVHGSVHLQSGIYYIAGDVSIGAQASVTGTNVAIVIVKNGTNGSGEVTAGDLTINGGADLNLTAPADGNYKGVAIYRDRRATDMQDGNGNGQSSVTINGNSSVQITGAVYLPSTNLTWNGSSDATSTCLQLVGWKITLSGGINISNQCTAAGGAMAFGIRVRLVA